MKNIVMTQALWKEGDALLRAYGEVTVGNHSDPRMYMDAIQKANCIIVRIANLTAETIQAAPNLEVIGRTGIGYDSIDVKAATERGIPIVLTPGANADAVAQHALAMLLAMATNLVEQHIETSKGNFAIRNNGKGIEIHGRTLGLIGTGDIARRFAKLAQMLGMKVIAYSPNSSAEKLTPFGIAYCHSLSEILKQSDVVSLHTPLTEETRNMIGLPELKTMKSSAFLINTARGGVVNEVALAEALNTDIIAGAAVDVFTSEPLIENHVFYHTKNIILTPHSAALTQESVIQTALMCAEGCIAIMNGERWPHVANPEVYQHPKWQKQSI